MRFVVMTVLLFVGPLLHACAGGGVQSQRMPGAPSPVSPWSNSGNPYQDPYTTYQNNYPNTNAPGSPVPSSSPADPGINIPDSGSGSGAGGIGISGPANCYKANTETCAIENLIFDKTNAYRLSRGLQPLKFGYRLGYAARDWSAQQANRGGISHSGFPSARNRVLVGEFGPNVPVDVSGENVAWTGYSSGTVGSVASDFAEMWWGSSGHRRNMLGDYESLGVGVFHGSRGWYATQIFGAE
ncbi:MAG: CAP domain-containing protein [Proteobacteria bacterium]|nr:CAP domain-containing protein [Pseudomonadota bacterium]